MEEGGEGWRRVEEGGGRWRRVEDGGPNTGLSTPEPSEVVEARKCHFPSTPFIHKICFRKNTAHYSIRKNNLLLVIITFLRIYFADFKDNNI